MNRHLRWLRTLSFLSLLLIPVVADESGLAAERPVDAAGDPLPPGIRMRMGSTRLWHRNLDKIRFTPDGKKLLSLGDDALSWVAKESRAKCRVWDVATGKLLKTLPGSAYPVAISRDSRWWVSYDKVTLRLTKTLGGKAIHTIALNNLQSAAITGNNKTLVALTTDYRVCRWDFATGKELSRRQYALVDRVDCADDPTAQLSPDGTLLVGVLHKEWSRGKETIPLRFWNTATGKEARPSLPVAGKYYECRWTDSGRKLVAIDRDFNVEIWDLKTGEKQARKKGGCRHWVAATTPDGKSRLLRAWEDVVSCDLATGKIRWHQNVAPHVPGPALKDSVVNRFAFNSDGRTAAVGSNCGRIVLLDWRTGKYVKGSSRQFGLYKEGMFGSIFDDESVMFSPDGSRLLVADAMNRKEDVAVLCDVRTGKELRRIKKAQILAWTHDGDRIAQRSWSKAGEFLQVTEATTGKELWKIKASPVLAIFSRDGRTITYEEYTGNYYVLDARTGKSRRAFRLPAAKAKDTYPKTISPDGKLVVVSAAKGEEIQVLDIGGKKIWSKKAPRNWKSWSASFVGNSRLALDVTEKGVDSRVVHILDAATGRKHCEILTGERTYGSILAAAPDGQTFAVKGLKNKRELRDANTGRLIYAFEPQTARSHEIQFSPDGKWCAFNLDDHTIEVREAATGKLVNRFGRPEHFLRDLTFAPNSRTIALTFNDCTVWLWDAIEKQAKPKRK